MPRRRRNQQGEPSPPSADETAPAEHPEPTAEELSAAVKALPPMTAESFDTPPPAVVLVTPSVAELRFRYDLLAAHVRTLKPDSIEYRVAMYGKQKAFAAWHRAANESR